jgi:sugar phosphate isomerase/epimerase
VGSVTSLTGVTLSFHSLGEIDLESRAAAAAGSGFTLVGLSVRRTVAWLADHPLGELLDLLARHGLAVGQLEVICPLRAEPDPLEGPAIALARDLGCGSIQASAPCDVDAATAADRLAAFADRAADVGAGISLEFLPWTNLASVAMAADLVRRAARPGLGVCVDVWHLYRSGAAPVVLDGLWPWINALQLSDGPLQSALPADLHQDCIRNRLVPGAGEFDLVGLLAAARRHAPTCHLSLEVICDELRALAPPEAVARIAAGTRNVLAAVDLEAVRA